MMPRATTTKGKAKGPAKKPVRKPAEDKVEKFIRFYRTHRNATQAYREAGYQATTSASQGAYETLRMPYVQARIAELDEADLAALDVKAFDVTRRLKNVAFADIANITMMHAGACRSADPPRWSGP